MLDSAAGHLRPREALFAPQLARRPNGWHGDGWPEINKFLVTIRARWRVELVWSSKRTGVSSARRKQLVALGYSSPLMDCPEADPSGRKSELRGDASGEEEEANETLFWPVIFHEGRRKSISSKLASSEPLRLSASISTPLGRSREFEAWNWSNYRAGAPEVVGALDSRLEFRRLWLARALRVDPIVKQDRCPV